MARIRTIKPEFCTSADVGALSRDARLFFLQLLTEADDAGRLLWLPRRLCGVLYPFDEDVGGGELEAWAAECQARGMVQLYTVDGVRHLAITNWDKHQRINRATPSKLPEPPEVKAQGMAGENSCTTHGGLSEDVHRERNREGNREQGTGKGSVEGEPPAAPARPPKGGRTLSAWAKALPKGEKPIPPGDPVFAYAEKVGLPEDFLRLAWRWMLRQYGKNGPRDRKRYVDWRKVFRNAVEGNWGKLWYVDGEGRYALTTVGLQLQRALEAAA